LPASALTKSGVPRRRWRIAFLLAAGVLVSFFDRINLSVSRDALHASFGLSVIAFGYLSSAFSWSYAAVQMPVGVLLDRWGVRRVGRLSAFLWSIASFAAALSPGLAWLFGARLVLGVSEASTFPANAKALGYWFTHEERSLATAITDAAAKFSNAVGFPFIGLLLVYFGWRWSFAITGIISFLYFVLFYCVYRNPSEDKDLSDREREFILAGGTQPEGQVTARRGSSLGYLLRQRKVYGLALGWGAYNYTFYLFLVWLPTYFSMSVHLDPLHSAFYSGVPWLFAAATDLVVGGWLVDALIRRGYDASRVRQTVMGGGMVVGLAILGAAITQSPGTALVWISVALGGLAAAAPVAWTVPSLISPRESVGTVAGVVNLVGQIGAISASIATGYLVTDSHSFGSAFVTAGIILLLGIVGYAILLGRIEPIPESWDAGTRG
jgi:ACS family D-galactonate transporter-like MFS transporter